MSGPRPGWTARPVRLLETAGPPPPVYVLSLALEEPGRLLAHEEARLLFATSGGRARVVGGSLALGGSSCVYRITASTWVTDGAFVPFVRQPACASMPADWAGDLRLTLELAERRPIGVWTYQPPSGTSRFEPDFIVVRDVPGVSGPGVVLRGRYVDALPGPGWRRIDLLNYLWQVSDRVGWIWLTVGCSGLLALLGLVLYPMRPVEKGQAGRRFRLATVGAIWCFAASLGLLYAVLVPPLHGPDEPDHLLSYARFTDAAEVTEAAADLARRDHLDRIRFQNDEHFRPVHLGRPHPDAWDDGVFAEDVVSRSSTTAFVWRAVADWLEGMPVARLLLSVRLMNALIFSIALALGMMLVISAGTPGYPQLLGWGFLLVPALPFFAMYMSETAMIASAGVLLSCAMLFLFLDSPRAHWSGFALGLGAALTVASGRSAMPMIAAVAGVLIARVALGSRGSSTAGQAIRAAFVFWAGLAAGLGTFWLVATEAYVAGFGTFNGTRTMDTIQQWAVEIWRRPWIVLVVSALGFVAEIVQARMRGRREAQHPGRAIGTRLVAFGLAGLAASVLVASLFVDYPQLPPLGATYRPSQTEYVADVFGTVLTGLRARHPDFFLFSSFWGGFGWLDTIPRPEVLSALSLASSLSAIALLFHVGRTGHRRRFVWLLLFGGGLAASLAIYAMSTHAMDRNLVGRYMIGLHLAWLAIVWSAPALILGETRRPRVLYPILLPMSIGAVHAYSLCLILARYF